MFIMLVLFYCRGSSPGLLSVPRSKVPGDALGIGVLDRSGYERYQLNAGKFCLKVLFFHLQSKCGELLSIASIRVRFSYWYFMSVAITMLAGWGSCETGA